MLCSQPVPAPTPSKCPPSKPLVQCLVDPCGVSYEMNHTAKPTFALRTCFPVPLRSVGSDFGQANRTGLAMAVPVGRILMSLY